MTREHHRPVKERGVHADVPSGEPGQGGRMGTAGAVAENPGYPATAGGSQG
ncbi:hypothetical protein [Wenjunlia tyrosinilytica]|uniref:Uncharacterized protein n=1 Tax=Wenjunlia tyrosinilytica TaxID=1544741 RepID=A0A917ZYV2_9ACTN|nr:hypothetical protein [Wenjunlia tyrosinilytica]GGP01389.1 hypothetical protein GCM10012280_72110 [Wenjunlia tyrosinilytica]